MNEDIVKYSYVFDSYEVDLSPEMFALELKMAKDKVNHIEKELEKAKSNLWKYEWNSKYSKSKRRAQEAGFVK